jgi:hypothetical protein
MAFGLTNALGVFQDMMNDVFYEYLDDFVVCYINDILIFLKNMVHHERHVRLVLEKFQEVGIYAKLEMCGFHQPKVEFLGYIISRDNVHMDLCKVQTIVDWVTLISIQDFQCFLGFANFYQRSIAHYSTIMTPLIRLTWKDQPFSWELKLKMPFNL